MTNVYGTKSRSKSRKFKSNTYEGYFCQNWNYSPRKLSRKKFNLAIEPFVKQLFKYDRLRKQIEDIGGTLNLPVMIINTLNEEFSVKGLRHSHKIALTHQESIRSMLLDLGEFECKLQVRKLNTGMPVYYFCLTEMDYRLTYSLILEDIYQSSEYPIFDERFVKIMHLGHEVYFLRLSMFRQKTLTMLDKEQTESAQAKQVDEILGKVGRHIFQAAWHEDQFVGMAAANHFELAWFRWAIELLYLCLSGELCDLRRIINKDVQQFFVEVYPQPPISNFLSLLNQLDGEALSRVPQIALKLYPKLSRDFGSFLRVDLPWGKSKIPTPLFKLLFGNFWRLDMICNEIGQNEELRQAGQLLEKQSQEVIQKLFEGINKSPSCRERKKLEAVEG